MPLHNITGAHFRNFTAFTDLDLSFSPGINIFIGENGTGKTHILKALYSACDVTKTKNDLGQKLIDVFMPLGGRPGRLVHRAAGRHSANFRISREMRVGVIKFERPISVSFSTLAKNAAAITIKGKSFWDQRPIKCVYIPVKEMLANAKGFVSSYRQRELHFEEVYPDIIERANLQPLRGPTDEWRKSLLKILETSIEGRVSIKDEEFFLNNKQGSLEFSLVAEGIRKLALLLLLIQNGTLSKDSVLFWDEPETNLNPVRMQTVVEMILALQHHHVQIFLATHDYSVVKWFHVLSNNTDKIKYFSFSRSNNGITANSTEDYFSIHPNPIAESFDHLYEKTMEKEMEK